MRLFRPILGILAIAGLSACSQLPADLKAALMPSEPHTGTPTTETTSKLTSPPEEKPAVQKSDLSQIIRMLEDGQQDQARAALKAFRAKDPKNPVALSLQQQLEADPVRMLGQPTDTYTVQSGDTLGGLAERFLGNPLKFVILARYNHIARSKDLRVGQIIRLPATTIAHPQATPEVAPEPMQSAAPDQTTPKPRPTEALTQPEPSPEKTEKPDPQSMRLVQKYHEQALIAYRRQDLDQAIALWDKALAIDPSYEPALGYRARALELKKRLDQLGGGAR